MSGQTVSGNYIFHDRSSNYSVSYCNFSKSITDSRIQKRIGKVEVTDEPPTPVMFHAEKRSGNIRKTELITYTHVLINQGGGMSTNGKFTAPKAGHYMFVLSGEADYQWVLVNINLQRNGRIIKKYEVNADGGSIDRTLSKPFMLTLKKGDVVFLENVARLRAIEHAFDWDIDNYFTVDSKKPFTFSGYRMTT
jgi:hypothetical protein